MSDDKHRASFLGLVYLVRQMTIQLLEQGQHDEARTFVDTIEALQVKTKGNLDEEEEKLLEGALHELRMAVVQGPAIPSETPESDDKA